MKDRITRKNSKPAFATGSIQQLNGITFVAEYQRPTWGKPENVVCGNYFQALEWLHSRGVLFGEPLKIFAVGKLDNHANGALIAHFDHKGNIVK